MGLMKMTMTMKWMLTSVVDVYVVDVTGVDDAYPDADYHLHFRLDGEINPMNETNKILLTYLALMTKKSGSMSYRSDGKDEVLTQRMPASSSNTRRDPIQARSSSQPSKNNV